MPPSVHLSDASIADSELVIDGHDGSDSKPMQDLETEPLHSPLRPSWAHELKVLMGLTLPLIAQMVSQQGMVLTDAACVGRLLGTEALAAAAVGNTIFSLGWYFLLGGSTALDTLASQCHGAGDEAGVVRWMITTGIVLSCTTVPFAMTLFYAGWIASNLLGQSEEISALVSIFCRGLIWGLLPAVWAVVLQKALATRNIVTPPALICGATAIANIGLNLALLPALGMYGAPLATTLSRWLQFFATAAYWAWNWEVLMPAGAKNAPSEFCRRAASNQAFRTFLYLALPGAMMLGLEASSFDATTAVAARLGTIEVDAHTTLLAVVSFSFISLPFGLACASTIRVGNLLGANDPQRARISGILTIAAGTFFMACSAAAIMCARNKLGAVFVDDPAVIALVASIAPVGASFQVWDGLQGTAAGVLRGLGKQKLLVASNLLGLWAIGFALGVTLAFPAGMRLKGVWLGTSVGLAATAIINLAALARTDWPLESQRAMAIVSEHSLHFGSPKANSSPAVTQRKRGRGYVELAPMAADGLPEP